MSSEEPAPADAPPVARGRLGRAHLYGLAAAREDGVARAGSLPRAEIQRALALVGRASVRDLDRSFLRAAR